MKTSIADLKDTVKQFYMSRPACAEEMDKIQGKIETIQTQYFERIIHSQDKQVDTVERDHKDLKRIFITGLVTFIVGVSVAVASYHYGRAMSVQNYSSKVTQTK